MGVTESPDGLPGIRTSGAGSLGTRDLEVALLAVEASVWDRGSPVDLQAGTTITATATTAVARSNRTGDET